MTNGAAVGRSSHFGVIPPTLICLLAFTGGIAYAGFLSFGAVGAVGAPAVDQLPSIVSYFFSAANATLAANFGTVRGIAVTIQARDCFHWQRRRLNGPLWEAVSPQIHRMLERNVARLERAAATRTKRSFEAMGPTVRLA